MFGLAISIFALVTLVLCWLMGEAEFRTKVIFTVIFLVTVGWSFLEPLTGMVAQGCLGAVLWWMTFGSRGR
jgi:hypothetical protein